MQRIVLSLLFACVLGAGLYPHSAGAQAPSWDATVRTMESRTNLYATLDASSRISGVRLQVPKEWEVLDAYLLRYGTVNVPVGVEREGAGTVVVTAGHPLQGPHELVLQVRTGPSSGAYRWQITPFEWVTRVRRADTVRQRQYLASRRHSREVTVERPSRTHDSNRAFDLGGADGPLILQRADDLAMGRGASFTLEFWLRTTGLDEVVMSTWTGDEDTPYPAEFTVDQSGRLRFYCGRRGQHQALRSTAPVADGDWHHAAVVYDASASQITLLLDGMTVDSVQARALPRMTNEGVFGIGGRPSQRAQAAGNSSDRPYSGWVDELRLWPKALSAATIRKRKGRSLSASDERRFLRLGFDESEYDDALVWPAGAQRRPATLSFQSPLRDLQAQTDGRTVILRWKADAANEGTFIVERSPDGNSFRTVDRVNPMESTRASSESQVVEYRDENVSGQVVYYRIRQVSAQTGVERTTGTVKIGLGGRAENSETASLVGNFPNPFEDATTIAYRVTEAQPVTLTIWNVSGKRVSTLATGMHQPGYYEKTLTAEDLPSGTYFVRLETSRDVQSHRLVLVK